MKNKNVNIYLQRSNGEDFDIEECDYELSESYISIFLEYETLIYPLHDIKSIEIEYRE